MTITLPGWFPILGLVVAFIGLIFAIRNYLRKSGRKMRGNFQTASSIESNDQYISTITIENMKDRGVTIYAIYLRIGHNHFIELENFGDKPLVLKAYETYHKEFGPIQFYGFNMRRFRLNELLLDRRAKKRLVLSTGDGKYTVPKPIKKWNPASDFFRNNSTAIIRPTVLMFKDHYVGENIKYILEFVSDNKQEELVLLQPDEFRFNRFKNFRLTKESLETKENLELFLQDQKDLGKLSCSKFFVHDTTEWRKRTGEYFTEEINAEYVGWFAYHVTARLATWLSDRQMAKHNRDMAKRGCDAISKTQP